MKSDCGGLARRAWLPFGAVALMALAQVAGSAVPTISVDAAQWPQDLGSTAKLGPLVYRGGLTLSSPDADFRGYSGIWVSADGKALTGVEGGKWIEARLTYDRDGNLNGFRATDGGLLLDETGKPFATEDDRDAEAVDFDGRRFLVGFETHDRVLAYRSLHGPAEAIALPPEALDDIMRGAGYSSVAALKGGGTAFLAEYTYPVPGSKTFVPGVRTRGWLRLRDGTAGPFWLRPTPKWLPVDLRQLPDGDLLLMQVHIGPGPANIDQSRLSRVKLSELTIGATINPDELAVFAPPVPSPWIEAIAVRRGSKGETLVYVMTNTSPARLFLFAIPGR